MNYLHYAIGMLFYNVLLAWGVQKLGGTPIPNLFCGAFFFSYGIYKHLHPEE